MHLIEGLESGSLEEGKRVLETEAAAILKLSQNMPRDFEALVEAMIEFRGRLIVSGLGKSGHVARKIAATFSSTGTPAYFLHAAEASHGDLGMVDASDICLLISNSGETGELRHLVTHAKRFSLPLAVISSHADSTLVRAADFRLVLPNVREACPIGMAPTTSTTMAMALGDALAVSLMSRRGFMPDDFHVLHPGGRLGVQMMRVSDLMHTGDSVPLVHGDTAMNEVLLTMTRKGFGIAGILEHDRLGGVFTDGDLRRNMQGLMGFSAREIATKDPVVIGEDALAAEALALMNDKEISALIVLSKDGKPVGVLHVHDLLRAGLA